MSSDHVAWLLATGNAPNPGCKQPGYVGRSFMFHQGFTLIEILIALSIFSLTMLCLLSDGVTRQKGYARFVEHFSMLQRMENMHEIQS
jgi:prepilin-type N-terminal cleavage/methylation domain-containing protein